MARQPLPDFTRRLAWAGYALIENSQASDESKLSKQIHAATAREQIKKALSSADVETDKVEHVFRVWGQSYAIMAGGGKLSADEINKHGGWTGRVGVREHTYQSTPSIQACLVLGGHGARHELEHGLRRPPGGLRFRA